VQSIVSVWIIVIGLVLSATVRPRMAMSRLIYAAMEPLAPFHPCGQ